MGLLPNPGLSALHIQQRYLKDSNSTLGLGLEERLQTFGKGTDQAHLPRTINDSDSRGTVPHFRTLDLALQ